MMNLRKWKWTRRDTGFRSPFQELTLLKSTFFTTKTERGSKTQDGFSHVRSGKTPAVPRREQARRESEGRSRWRPAPILCPSSCTGCCWAAGLPHRARRTQDHVGHVEGCDNAEEGRVCLPRKPPFLSSTTLTASKLQSFHTPKINYTDTILPHCPILVVIW